MDQAPDRPDTQRLGVRPRPSMLGAMWVGVAGIVGVAAIVVITRIRGPVGPTPPTSMFCEAGVAMSAVAFITVMLAARSAGVAMRASLALAGGLGVVAIVKFSLGPIAMFHAAAEFQDPFALGSAGSIVAIGGVVLLLYVGAVMALGAWRRPRGWASWPRPATAAGTLLLGVVGLVAGAFVTDAPLGYVGFALTGIEATAVVVSLSVAATLVAAAFHDASQQAKSLGVASVYVSCVWVAIAFVLVFHVLWVVFMLAVVAIWPLKTVTPK
jgi:hypothetical protein